MMLCWKYLNYDPFMVLYGPIFLLWVLWHLHYDKAFSKLCRPHQTMIGELGSSFFKPSTKLGLPKVV